MAAPGRPAALLLLLRLGLAAAFPNGRVTESCGDMVPRHGHPPSPDPKHSVAVARTTFSPGDQIEVAVSGPEFKGFLLEARDAEDPGGAPVGSFTLIDKEVSQLLACGGKEGSAVSHTSAHKKTAVRALWDAPRSAPNHVQFLATVVEKYKSYWVRIPSPVISQPKAPPLSTPAATPAPSPASPAASVLSEPFSAAGCGSSKFCVRSPAACDPAAERACLFLSFTPDGRSVTVELSGPSQGYLSFALSHDRWMGDDDAYLCIHDNQAVSIRPAHLTGRSHPVLDSWDTLEGVAWRLQDDGMQCSFRRDIALPGVKSRFDLNTSYYIFLATGAAEDGKIYRHSQQPLITYEKHDVTGDPQDVGASQAQPLLRAHGALMLVGWMTTVSVGVIVARFFKPVLSRPLFGEAAWFQVHRALMLLTSVLTCIAFVLPFLYRRGWSSHAGYHPYLGCVVLVLAVLQLLLAVLRPALNDPRRQLFNWTHWGLGTVARIVAVAAMFLGTDLPALALPGPWKTYTMLGFVAWHVGTEVLLEVHSYRLSRKVEILDDTRIQIMQPFTMAEAEEGHGFKKAVLAVYVCGNVTFLVIFLSAVSRL
ncbi:unnamed protein product [Pipistrellus nathusii]|uniref:Ferric-chelate reductase 1 n=1 Tax=Pipistrellus nathusii TaxID=59473 RepID=A0ABN9ZLH0_PIPNA